MILLGLGCLFTMKYLKNNISLDMKIIGVYSLLLKSASSVFQAKLNSIKKKEEMHKPQKKPLLGVCEY